MPPTAYGRTSATLRSTRKSIPEASGRYTGRPSSIPRNPRSPRAIPSTEYRSGRFGNTSNVITSPWTPSGPAPMNVIRSTNSSMDNDLPTRSTRSSCRTPTFVKEGSDVFSLFIQFPGTEKEKEGPWLVGNTRGEEQHGNAEHDRNRGRRQDGRSARPWLDRRARGPRVEGSRQRCDSGAREGNRRETRRHLARDRGGPRAGIGHPRARGEAERHALPRRRNRGPCEARRVGHHPRRGRPHRICREGAQRPRSGRADHAEPRMCGRRRRDGVRLGPDSDRTRRAGRRGDLRRSRSRDDGRRADARRGDRPEWQRSGVYRSPRSLDDRRRRAVRVAAGRRLQARPPDDERDRGTPPDRWPRADAALPDGRDAERDDRGGGRG